jgi:iron(III) transport system permease protein
MMATRTLAQVWARRGALPALPRVDPLIAVAAVPAAIVVGLLLLVAWVSLVDNVTSPALTLRHYATLYTDRFAYLSFLNTLGFASIALVVALLFGLPIAWLVERTDLPGKSLIFMFMTASLLVPGFFTAMGWLFLAHPRIGLLNQLAMGLLGLESAPFTIISIPGMGWVQGLGLASVVFIMTAASLRAMDASLEEAAQTSGASFLATLRRITLPLALPGLLAASLYVFTIGISAFDIPLIIGLSNRIFVFSTYLYVKSNPQEGLPDYGLAAAFATFMVLLALLLSWLYSRVLVRARQYQVITGKSYQPRLVRLGRWAIVAWLFIGAYLLLSKLVPLAMLAWAALLPYFQPPSPEALQHLTLRNFLNLPWPLVTRGLSNSLALMLGAPTLALALSLLFSWVVLRSRSRYRLAFDFVAFLPHAVPNVVFGLAALLAALFVIRGPVDLYGSLLLLLLTYAIVQLSFGTRSTNSALIQIHTELEEAAAVAGATPFVTWRRVVLPLLRPALLYAWLWLALLTVRELTLATVLFSPQNITLSVVVWSLWHAGQLAQAAAVTLLMLLVFLPLAALYWRLSGGVRRA